MKKVLLLSAAVLAMTACSNTDVIEEGALQQTNAIGFQSMVNKGSRALDATSFNNFYVFGSYVMPTSTSHISIFNGEAVSKSGDTWSYTNPRYWVKDGKYQFYAYSNDNSALVSGEGTADFGTTGILNINNYVADATHQKDLIFAKSTSYTGKETGNDPVSLEFSHALARIMVTFKSNFPAGYNLKISDVKVNGLYTTGNYRSEDGEAAHAWTIANSSAPTTGHVAPAWNGTDVAKAAEGNVEAQDAKTAFAYVIPNNYGNQKIVSIEFDMHVTHGDVAILGRKMKVNWAPVWASNHQYNYNITINGNAAGLEPIEFTANIGDWVEGTPTVDNMDLGVDYEATASE